MAESSRESNWDEATRARDRADRNLVATVKQLVVEHYMTYGTWPSEAWLLQQIGLKP